MNYNRALTGVVIDPGHGGEDSGAVGNGIVEKDLTLTSDNRPGVALSKFGNGENVIIISNHINAGGGEFIYHYKNLIGY